MPSNDGPTEFSELPSEEEIEVSGQGRLREAVTYATDWTTETIVSQLRRGNIVLDPSFQRRDAWDNKQKSRFIESLLLGLPIPQIVLAEDREKRGTFIVLDGKQRLLSILQFWGLAQSKKNDYALSGLEVRKDLNRKRLSHLESDVEHEDDLNLLLNQTIRTVVIRNWPDRDFLHLVFLRLNTGSLKLSPQELRQAMFPGPFSDWIDESAVSSAGIRSILKLSEPDKRMRDIEILARYIAFRFFLEDYHGRMTKFLDAAFEEINSDWEHWKPLLEEAMVDFEEAVRSLTSIFGEQVGRKPESVHFNRAVFDFLVFYAQVPAIRNEMEERAADIRRDFDSLFESPEFRGATERDTAGVPNTVLRLSVWGEQLSRTLSTTVPVPRIVTVQPVNADNGKEEQRIEFSGF